MNKTLEYYMGLPYTIELWRAAEGGWVIKVKELPGCVSQGETADEALAMIQEAMEAWLDIALEMGDAIPEPRPEEEYSGKFVVRVPRSLHRELVATADREGVSLNQYINVALGKATGREPAGAGPVPVEELGWPGLRLGVRQVLMAAGLGEDAEELDERLFGQWVEGVLGQVEAATTGGYDRDALFYLEALERALAIAVARSPALQVFARTAALLRHQIVARHEAERQALDPLAVLARVTDLAQSLNTGRANLVFHEQEVQYLSTREEAMPDLAQTTVHAGLRQIRNRQG